jgi:hypothetical protein
MKQQDEQILQISGTRLWLVPVTENARDHRLQVVEFPGLDPFVCDLDQDEHALVRAFPGEPFYCYRCKVSSDDANLHVLKLVQRGDADLLGVPAYGCLDTDAVAQLMFHGARHRTWRK